MVNINQDALAASLRRLEGGGADTEDLQQTLADIVFACTDVFGVTGGGLLLADEQDVLRYVVATDAAGRVLEHVQTETGQGPCIDTFVGNTIVTSSDMLAEQRWPATAPVIADHGVLAVLGVPVRLGGGPVGSLNVYRDRPHVWDDSEERTIGRYARLIERSLASALDAKRAGDLAEQLQYALDYRVVIERAVGFLMARDDIDAVLAFNRLRSESRNLRRKIGQVAESLLSTRRLPSEQAPSQRPGA